MTWWWSRRWESGQSETDVEEVCDTVAVVVQPGSGDTLQFLKAGIMEVPDVLVVTKADLGDVAVRARRDLAQALAVARLGGGAGRGRLVAVAAQRGIDELAARSTPTPANLDLPATRLSSAAAHGARGPGCRARRGRAARARRPARGRAVPRRAGAPKRGVPELTAALEERAGLA